MLAPEVEAFAAVGDGAHEHRLVRPEVVAGIGLGKLPAMIALYGYEIEDGGSEAADRAALLQRHISRHGEGFQVDFGTHDGRTEVEKRASLQALDCAREDQEIAITGRAQRRAVAVGMLVYDVVADAGVHRHGHTRAIRR